MEHYTYTMSNITVVEYYHQALSINIIIEIKDNGDMVCNVHRIWTTLGDGKVIVTFQNQADFRTVISMDMKQICEKALDHVQEIETINSVEMFDASTRLSQNELSIFNETWHICNDAIMIAGKLYRLSEFHLWFKVDGFCDEI